MVPARTHSCGAAWICREWIRTRITTDQARVAALSGGSAASGSVCENHRVTRIATALVITTLLTPACGDRAGDGAAVRTERPTAVESSVPGTVTRGDASSDLDTTPLSAADYQMYAAIMGGASAMLTTLSDADRHALEFARRVERGHEAVTPETEPLMVQARALRTRDLELARLQGIEPRYAKVKEKVEAVIGPDAKPPSDPVSQENLRYLDAHRDTIERLQNILRDPLSRPAP